MKTIDSVVTISDVEALRLETQVRLDAAKTQEERNRLGQFATPTPLATDILTCAREMLPESQAVRFLDPAFGTGSFYAALRRVFSANRIATATGFEIDPHYGAEAQRLWRGTGLNLKAADFTRVPPPEDEHEKYNLVICNPPYVRHHHIPLEEKRRLLELTRQSSGIQLNGLAGLYCYFMLLCHQWMAEGGLAGWLIPSEFMDVNYGRQVKRYLLERVTLLRIHRFRPEDVQFDDAMVSSVVVWFRKQQPAADHVVEFTYGGTLNDASGAQEIAAEQLGRMSKWTGVSTRRATNGAELLDERPFEATLGDLFHVKRGIATGANSFFILDKERVIANNLPREFLTPILPSPRSLDADEVLADGDGNPELAPQLFLINCSLPESTVRSEFPTLWRYLESGKEQGIHLRYLCSHRTPWYAQENRPAAPLLCTYMGRQTPGKAKPFRFILNHSQATAPNVYLMLYPRPVLAAELTRKPRLLSSVWTMLNQLPAQTLVGEGRVYGGGLHKIEPAELSNAPIDGIARLVPDLFANLGRQLPLFDP